MNIRLSQQELRDLTGEHLPSDQTRVLTELDIRFAVLPNGSVVVMRKTIADRNQHLHRLWRKHCEGYEEYEEALEAWHELPLDIRRITSQPESPKFPEELRDVTCGAKTRKGTFCKRLDLAINGRCRLHGGLSTGPRTMEGKQRSAQNGRCPKGVEVKAMSTKYALKT